MKSHLLLSAALLACTVKAMAGAGIHATPSTLTSFNYVTGSGPSPSQTVVLNSYMMGTLYDTGTITVLGTSAYEVSLNNTTFSGSASIHFKGDTLGATNVYVRLKAGQAAGFYDHAMLQVTATNTGVNTSIDASGYVSASALNITVGAVSGSSANLSWSSGTPAPDSWEYQLDMNAANPTGSGTMVTTPSYNASGLAGNTTYYLHVRGKYGIDYSNWTTKSFKTSPTAVATVPGIEGDLIVFPNPGKNAFSIQASATGSSQALSIALINAVGQVVLTRNSIAINGHIDEHVEASLPAGLYTVRLSCNAGTTESRLVIAP